MKDRGKISILLTLILIAICSLCYVEIRKIDIKSEARVADVRKFAGVLAAQKLYNEAAAYLEKHITENLIAPEEREATMMYLANLYLDNIGNCEKAMAFYLRVLNEFPNGKYAADASRRIVDAKARLGRNFEALNEMEALNRKQSEKSSPRQEIAKSGSTAENNLIVAKIGEENITLGDFAREADVMYQNGFPFDMNKRENKIKLLKDVLAQTVLKRIAVARRLDMDYDVIKKSENFKNQIMIQKLLEKEVASKAVVDDMSVKLYYDAHREEMRTPDKFKFSYIETANETDAVAVSSNNDHNKFASLMPKELPMGTLMEAAGALNLNLFEASSEIALAKNGDIIKKVFKTGSGKYLALKINDLVKGDVVPFNEAKEGIRRALTARKSEDEIQNYVMKNFADMNVIVFEEAFGKAQIDTSEANIKK